LTNDFFIEEFVQIIYTAHRFAVELNDNITIPYFAILCRRIRNDLEYINAGFRDQFVGSNHPLCKIYQLPGDSELSPFYFSINN
jgi:hypothetical protein